MNKQFKIEFKSYIRSVSKKVNCSFTLKKAFISELKYKIIEFVQTKDDVSIKDVHEKFGSPEEIANSFGSLTNENLLRKAKLYKILIILGIIALLLVSIILYLILRHYGSHEVITEPYEKYKTFIESRRNL